EWLLAQQAELRANGGPGLAGENMPHVPQMGSTGQRTDIAAPKYRICSVDEIARFPAITFDTTHFATAEVDILDAYGALRERVRHIHLSDFLAGKEHRRPGTGDLHLDLFLLALIESGYDDVITLELAPDAL